MSFLSHLLSANQLPNRITKIRAFFLAVSQEFAGARLQLSDHAEIAYTKPGL